MIRMRQLTGREKAILSMALVLFGGSAVYFGFLEGFLDRYQSVRSDLETNKTRLAAQLAVLRRAPRVARQFAEIEDSLPRITPGRGPEMVFTEDFANICRDLGIPMPDIEPHKVQPIPRVPGFAYLILPFSKVNGDLGKIARVLNGFYDRNLVIQSLKIAGADKRGVLHLSMSGEVAQILREKDLHAADRAALKGNAR